MANNNSSSQFTIAELDSPTADEYSKWRKKTH